MKKVLLSSIAIMSLSLAACSAPGATPEQSTADSTEQVSAVSSVSSSSSQTTSKGIAAFGGRTAYEAYVEEFTRYCKEADPDCQVVSRGSDMAVVIGLALSDEQVQKSQSMVDGIYKIKQAGEEVLQEYEPGFKAPRLVVLDANLKVIAMEEDGRMVLG